MADGCERVSRDKILELMKKSIKNKNKNLDPYNTFLIRAPLVIAVNRIGDQCVLDADLMEEACTSSTLFVGVKPPPQEKTQVKLKKN